MRRIAIPALTCLSLLAAMLATAPPAAATPAGAPARTAGSPAQPASDNIEVYTGQLTAAQLTTLRGAAVDHEDITLARGARPGRVSVEVVLGPREAARLIGEGVDLRLKRFNGQTSAQRAGALAAQGDGVFRPYSGPGNIRAEILDLAAANPNIAQAVDIGTSVHGKPITAVRVTRDARRVRQGARPVVLYQATQHAREWITPEMVRRLLHHYVEGYGRNREITRIVDTTELWFIPVVNVDAYDHTFTEGNRLWRKNLRDNNGDGQITADADGVDLNRNFPYKWGYDNEGSSANQASNTYRGPAPASEPETDAQVDLVRRLRPTQIINWHSAAELLLHGVGWQQATRSPDDLIYEAMVGDDEHPAVPGYDPDLSAELYTTNGEYTAHMHNELGALATTPEMSTCQAASAVDPNDEWEPADCVSSFIFPDDERLIQREFANNVAYALATAKSAHDPENPVSAVGRTPADFEVDRFAVSYGASQPVATLARRSMTDKALRYRINGGAVRTASVREWQGGERYGRDGNRYYAEYRGTVREADPGDRVEAWFTARKGGRQVASEHFTYRVRDRNRAEVLVISNEDYKGVNPTYPPTVTRPKYDRVYLDALRAAGVRAQVWDVTAEGVPHDLGVLRHFDAVVWYMGDNRLTQDPEDEATESPGGPLADASVAEREHYLHLAVRDYLNEGGKLLQTAETAGYYGNEGVGGIYYGLNGHPDRQCDLRIDECLLLADDFRQYWLGGYDRAPGRNPTRFAGAGGVLGGVGVDFGGPATTDNPLNEAGGFQITSDVLPREEFPQFASASAGDYTDAAGAFEPVEGSWYVAGTHEDGLYRRLTRTVDLTGVRADQRPTLEAQMSYATESGFDHIIVEAHTVGGEDWTTLPDVNGRTTNRVPTQCEQGFLLDMHPWLTHYLTGGSPCANTGSSGAWNSLTGSSAGWTPASYDLSAYAGKQVEVSIAYVSDPGAGATGLFVDDTKLIVGGGTGDAEGFESALGPWSVRGAPAGSPGNSSEFERSQALIDTVAAVSTRDTVLLGYGLEQVATPAERATIMRRVLRHLLG
jgi:hypothetical protein